ncbi:hypothetical protein B0A48_05354 [Cryoendolithus antarcticus]|uniref:SET domain-containing protein n=1 Tax=Cryoendolithus antarcticus TaxID=1507870 RepID=A0A1V8TI93_9PEZI|nr:hypothetical protein B0A48_05354 [Cryoendolithus antarcticus]
MASMLRCPRPFPEGVLPNVQDPLKIAVARHLTVTSMFQGADGKKLPEDLRPKSQVDLLFEVAAKEDREAKIPIMPVGESYAPCTTSIDQLNKIPLADLEVNNRAKDSVVIARCYRAPLQSWSRLLLAIEDTAGTYCIVALEYHRRDVADMFTRGSLVAIKQPCLKAENLYGKLDDLKGQMPIFMVHVDHPSDLVLLESKEEVIENISTAAQQKQADAKICKEQGNAALAGKMCWRACQMYTHGLKIVSENDQELKADLFRNRSRANLLLGQFDAAFSDAVHSLVYTRGVDSRAKSLKSKARYRAAAAAYNLGRYDRAIKHLDTMLSLTPADTEGRSLLSRVRQRIAERDHGLYDFELLRENCIKCGPMDVADFLCRTSVDNSPGRGRGLFATQDIPAHGLIFVEKAFAAALPTCENTRPAYRFHAKLHSGKHLDLHTGSDLNASLLKDCVDKLHSSPSRSSEFTDLFARGYPKMAQDAYNDVFLIDNIIRSNLVNINGSVVDGNMLSGNPGIWRQFSYINHACIPNAFPSFSGDVMVMRAQRKITKGEEITCLYASPSASFDNDSYMLTQNFKFTCDCLLCKVETSTKPKDRVRRNELVKKAPMFPGILLENTSKSKPALQAELERTIRLRDDLLATYDSKLFTPGVPRRGLANVHSQVSVLQYQLGDLDSAIIACQDALQSLGYHVRVPKTGNIDYRDIHGMNPAEAGIHISYLMRFADMRKQSGAAKQLRQVGANLHSLVSVDPEGTGIPDCGQVPGGLPKTPEEALESLKKLGLC